MKNENQIKDERQKKLMLMLPVLVLPFITIIFFLLGGGSGTNATAQVPKSKGLKTDLPGVNIKQEPGNKMSYYNQANDDSLKKNDLMKTDPYYQNQAGFPSNDQPGGFNTTGSSTMNSAGRQGYGYQDPYEARVYQKINALNENLNQNTSGFQNQTSLPSIAAQGSGMNNAEIAKLEKMMELMQSGSGTTEDPEMQQINGMLEKILEIQHPDRATEKIKTASKKNKGQVFPVLTNTQPNHISLLQAKDTGSQIKPSDGFFGLDNSNDQIQYPTNTIKAVVHGTQTLVSGSELKLRLVQDVYINGIRIPKDIMITGIVSLSGERLKVSIDQIAYARHLFPVELSVYDLTGLEGIRIEGAMSRDVAKQSGSNAIQELGIPMMDPSLAAQAATVGIEFTKNLLGKKTKLVRITVKAGHQVLLLDQNQKALE